MKSFKPLYVYLYVYRYVDRYNIAYNLYKADNQYITGTHQLHKIEEKKKFQVGINKTLTWANITAKQTWRRRVDFPPMLGPVRRMKLALSEPPMVMSLGTNEPLPKESLLRTGCPKRFAETHGTSFVHDGFIIIGRQVGPP